MPMSTTLVILRRVGDAALIFGYSARPIAEAVAGDHDLADDLGWVRLRTSFCVPVWQKLQVRVQPTWLEMQSVPRSSSGM